MNVTLICPDCGKCYVVSQEAWVKANGLFTCEVEGTMLLTAQQFDHKVSIGQVHPDDFEDWQPAGSGILRESFLGWYPAQQNYTRR